MFENLEQMANEQDDNKMGRCFKMSLSKQIRDFKMEIENFELWPRSVNKKTPLFFPEPGLKFWANLRIVEINSSDRVHLSFHLQEGDEVRIHHTAVIADSTGKELYRFPPKIHVYRGVSEKSCSLEPIQLDKMLHHTGLLIFKWTMEFVRFTESEPCKHMARSGTVNLLNLTSELKEMFIEAENADTTLKVGDVNVPVHKCIMSKRSPVFAKMFEANKIEYDIPDLEPQVLQSLVEFLYCATLSDDSFEFVHDLYHAADMFQIEDLRATCVSVVLSKLNVGNACQALVLAHEHQDDDFKKAVMDFVMSHFTEIVKTTEFGQFVKNQTVLSAEVIGNHVANC